MSNTVSIHKSMKQRKCNRSFHFGQILVRFGWISLIPLLVLTLDMKVLHASAYEQLDTDVDNALAQGVEHRGRGEDKRTDVRGSTPGSGAGVIVVQNKNGGTVSAYRVPSDMMNSNRSFTDHDMAIIATPSNQVLITSSTQQSGDVKSEEEEMVAKDGGVPDGSAQPAWISIHYNIPAYGGGGGWWGHPEMPYLRIYPNVSWWGYSAYPPAYGSYGQYGYWPYPNNYYNYQYWYTFQCGINTCYCYR